ncbi:protein FAM32A-like [Herrania umbratica]|uniref:Protein FAM32A-like n=1 Tax=Herrania umbratica TaxID=108875 RepID=A0A6J0ZNP2_9ROSI|nr:protein FAM32A-like [Herrania umbratica]
MGSNGDDHSPEPLRCAKLLGAAEEENNLFSAENQETTRRLSLIQTSAYENFVGGRLRLKGKPVHVKADGISKSKKKRHKHRIAFHSQGWFHLMCFALSPPSVSVIHETEQDGSEAHAFEDHLTPVERKFLEQTHKLELQKLAKMASKSRHDRIQEFNQYLANLTEHYDIPKVGAG